MKRTLISIGALAMAAAMPAAASSKSPLEGRWKNGSMVVQIAPCGGELCGTVVKASAEQKAKAESGSGTELIGARLIHDIERTGPATYRANVFVADRNMHASGTIRQINRNQLKVKGCVLAIFCKSKTWDRVR